MTNEHYKDTTQIICRDLGIRFACMIFSNRTNETCSCLHHQTKSMKKQNSRNKHKRKKASHIASETSDGHCLSIACLMSQGVHMKLPPQLRMKNKRQPVRLPNGKPVSRLYAQSSKWSWISRMA